MYEGKRSRSRHLVARYEYGLLHRPRYELEARRGHTKSRSQASSQIAPRIRSARQHQTCHDDTTIDRKSAKAGPLPHLSDRARSIPPHVIVQLFWVHTCYTTTRRIAVPSATPSSPPNRFDQQGCVPTTRTARQARKTETPDLSRKPRSLPPAP
jgi:hypothetical protein